MSSDAPRQGALVDGGRPLSFVFDGKRLGGLDGDSLASALLANDIRLVGRSFKYHRPRGIMGIGCEEPNALVELGEGARREPNTRATQVRLSDGLVANSQNRWPTLRIDLQCINDWMAPFLPTGFYYKTFMAPARAWPLYEHLIRRLAGLGRAPVASASAASDASRYDRTYAHCDVLVAGAGGSGLAAALAAARAGARVLVADESAKPGLGMLGLHGMVDGQEPYIWARSVAAELAGMPNVVLLADATVIGVYEDNLLAIAERCCGADPGPRQRLWKVRAGRIVVAAGAIERPLLFHRNDRPGVMLASAAAGYLSRYGVRVARCAVVATNNDLAYRDAAALAAGGVRIAAIVDSRPAPAEWCTRLAADAGIEVLSAHAPLSANGRSGVRSVTVARIGAATGRRARRIECDALLMSGGWTPTVHLYSHARGKLVHDAGLNAFVPGDEVGGLRCVGSCAGVFRLAEAIGQGFEAGQGAARAQGFAVGAAPPRVDEPGHVPGEILPAWQTVPAGRKIFVDFQNDVTAADVMLAHREGYRSVEHLKRYTTLGMGTDQGKTSNMNGLGLLALGRGVPVAEVGTTTFRPPYTPTTLGAFAGGGRPESHHPVRHTAVHRLHEQAGAVFVNSGLWRRPQFYRRIGENDLDAVNREVLQARRVGGFVDVSTLGKIDIQGPDATELLQRVYANGFGDLPVGKGRYGIMLREDGMVFDDGVTMRLGETHYLMSTTTGQVQAAYEHMTRMLQCVWRDLDVHLTDVTEAWFSCALVGPKARDVLARLVTDADISRELLPFMGCTAATIAGIRGSIFRISFSGELSFELNVPGDYAAHLWRALVAAGEPDGVGPYGVESMGVMRVEKGYFVIGREADGRVSLDDLGLGRMASRKKDFVGRAALALPAFGETGRKQLVGIRVVDAGGRIPRGSHLVEPDGMRPPRGSVGHVSSQVFSPTLGRSIGLALAVDGRSRIGDRLVAVSPLARAEALVELVQPVFVDPDGERLHA